MNDAVLEKLEVYA